MNTSVLDELTQIRKMLEAQMRSEGHVHWIGGYAPGQTKQGDAYIILYPASPRLKIKACRVYPHDFKKLPDFIDRTIPPGVGNGNPDKDEARAAGIYQECPMFKIATFDGKETNFGPERRFSDVLVITNKVVKT